MNINLQRRRLRLQKIKLHQRFRSNACSINRQSLKVQPLKWIYFQSHHSAYLSPSPSPLMCTHTSTHTQTQSHTMAKKWNSELQVFTMFYTFKQNTSFYKKRSLLSLSLSKTNQQSTRIKITLSFQVSLNYQVICKRFSYPILVRTRYVPPGFLQYSYCNSLQLQPLHYKQLQQNSTSGTSQSTPHSLWLLSLFTCFLPPTKLFSSDLFKSFHFRQPFSDALSPRLAWLYASFLCSWSLILS